MNRSKQHFNKKKILFSSCVAMIMLSIAVFSSGYKYKKAEHPGWKKMQDIVSRIKAPKFKNKTFNITDFGAKGDGLTDCSDAFAKAISKCSKSGGGMVLVPQGRYLTGAIHLKSNVNLHLEENSEILFSQDPRKYLPLVRTRFGGTELMNYSPFIYAYEQENIAITGKGTLNGQADASHWWNWNGWGKPPRMQDAAVERLYKMAQKNVPVEERIFGQGSYIRTNFVQPYKCKNVLIEGITLINSPAWILHPVLCNNVIIRDVSVNSTGPNNDGLDPESCKDVLIKNCSFKTGDDCIAIKSGKDHDGRRLNIPCENIVIQDCTFSDGHGGVVIGSEISGGVRNVFAENNTMDSPHLDRAIRIKSNSYRGGFIENVYVRNTKVGKVKDAVIRIDMFYYDEEQKGKYPTAIRNINIENISSQKSNYGLRITGGENFPVENVRIENAEFKDVKSKEIIKGVKNLSLVNVRSNGIVVSEK